MGKTPKKRSNIDLKAINEFFNNTKECEPAPPQSNLSVISPMEHYLTPLSDEETQASYQAWIS